MLGGSHIDEYYLDYIYVCEGPVDEDVFSSLPALMNCTEMINVDGGSSRNPKQDVRRFCLPNLCKCVTLIVTCKLLVAVFVDSFAHARRHCNKERGFE